MNVQVQAAQKCHFCGCEHDQGVMLVKGYICASCLDEITQTEVSNPRYQFFVKKLKELWQTG
ncbi:MAG: inhibitor of sigma-G Gin [Firmicutes bacterium]|nr:inhibitor of sigma-G Gin [Bacillota bacterium]